MITASFLPGQSPDDAAEHLTIKLEAMLGAVKNTMLEEMITLQRLVVLGKLQGQVLKHRTGHLGRSIIQDVTINGDTITGLVGVDKSAPYGAVHEFGGTFTIPEHPVRAFIRKNGSAVRAHTVSSHSVTLPERSFLRSAFQERLPEIIAHLETSMNEANT